MNIKSVIRSRMLKERNSFGQREIESLSLAITEKLIAMEQYKKSSIVMCYVSIGSEVRTENLISSCLRDGKRLAVPLVENKQNRIISACEIKDPGSELQTGTFGVPEPDCCRAARILPETIELIIVPGLAFDLHGNRIGYGAGYYDKFLKNTGADSVRIGVAYDFQVLEEIRAEAGDVPMDIIITEKRTVYTG